MPRKKLIYTKDFPYHVSARSNNKEWFYLPRDQMWNIFVDCLNHVVTDYDAHLHSFVLMDNHYHMMISAGGDYNLGQIMCVLQKSVSRTVNRITGRINHIFGGPYSGSIILSPEYYYNVVKYVYRNPMDAKVCKKVREYEYSSFIRGDELFLSHLIDPIAEQVPRYDVEAWINNEGYSWHREGITKGLRRTVFKPTGLRKY